MSYMLDCPQMLHLVVVLMPHLGDRMGDHRAAAALHHREEDLFFLHHMALEFVPQTLQHLRESGRR